MKPGIDPKVDFAFKKVFGSESNVDLLQDLLEAVLLLPAGSLTAVEVLNPFNEKETGDDKLSVLDVKARDASGRWFNVEMQMVVHTALRERVLYYWARVYGQQMVEGKSYEELCPTVSICFLNSRLFPRSPAYHRWFVLIDPATGEQLTDHLNIHFLELPKFTLGPDELNSPLERWCYFLRYAESLDDASLPATLSTPAIHKAMEVLNVITQSDRDRARYESRHMGQLDQIHRERQLQAALAREREAQAREREAQAREREAQVKELEAQAREREAQAREREAQAREREALEILAKERAALEVLAREREALERTTAEGLARAQAAVVEGRAEVQRKATVEQIHFCQSVLKVPPAPLEELEGLALEELLRRADELKQQVLRAGS